MFDPLVLLLAALLKKREEEQVGNQAEGKDPDAEHVGRLDEYAKYLRTTEEFELKVMADVEEIERGTTRSGCVFRVKECLGC